MNQDTIEIRADSIQTETASRDAPIAEPHSLAHGPGALRTILLVARVTFLEAARRKILWIAALVGIAFLALFYTALHYSMLVNGHRIPLIQLHENLTMMTLMVMYAGSMMTSLMAVLISCDTLSGEVSFGTIHAIATKPVQRWCLVFGKWIGFLVMLSLYVPLIAGGAIADCWLASGYLPPHGFTVLSLVWLQAVVLLSVTMLAGTRFSTLSNGAISLGLFGLAFVGGWIEQIGYFQHVKACVNLGILSSLIMPSDSLWRRAAFKFQPPLVAASGVSPFSFSIAPSNAMVVYAIVYALLAILLAQVFFARRDL